MKIAIIGASGFIGSSIRTKFTQNIILKRDDSEEEILEKLKDIDVVINLSGASIMQRWSEEYKEILYSSRIGTTKKLVNAINKSDVKQLISASAVGIYPDLRACDETTKVKVEDFLGHIVSDWEKEAKKCNKLTTILRLGVVLGVDGGTLDAVVPSFKMGLGGIIGDGQMMMSWIDLDDLMRIYQFVIENRLGGIVNAVSPNPISNFKFTKKLGKILHRPTFIPLPMMIVKMLFGEGSIVMSGSKEVYPKVLEENGMEFKYKNIEESLKHPRVG